MTEVTIAAVSLASVHPARLGEMLDLHARAVRGVCARDYEPETVEAWLSGRTPEGYQAAETAGERFVLAQRSDETVVALASWKPGQLISLYVDPDYHGEGIGARLFEFCVHHAADTGAPIRRVSATLNAVGFYERRGFIRIRTGGRIKRGVLIPHVEMEQELSACCP